ncbi:hypothetical protein D9M71_601050 [compost metagenome]
MTQHHPKYLAKSVLEKPFEQAIQRRLDTVDFRVCVFDRGVGDGIRGVINCVAQTSHRSEFSLSAFAGEKLEPFDEVITTAVNVGQP